MTKALRYPRTGCAPEVVEVAMPEPTGGGGVLPRVLAADDGLRVHERRHARTLRGRAVVVP